MAGYSRLTLFAPCSPLGGAGMALLAGWGGHAPLPIPTSAVSVTGFALRFRKAIQSRHTSSDTDSGCTAASAAFRAVFVFVVIGIGIGIGIGIAVAGALQVVSGERCRCVSGAARHGRLQQADPVCPV